MDLYESNPDKSCAACGTPLGLRRYKPQMGSSKRFCTIAHLESWMIQQQELDKERRRKLQQHLTFDVIQGGRI